MRRSVIIAGVIVIIVGALAFWLGSIAGWFQDDLPSAPPSDFIIGLEPVRSGFDAPLDMFELDGQLFVVEQGGRIAALDGTTWFDIDDRVRSGGERGLLSATPSPSADRLYVHYSDADGDTVIAWFPLIAGQPVEDERTVLQVDQPYANHNGGTIAFGPDGYLYIGLGDGGLAADPDENGQDPHTLLGSILRIDPSGGSGYDVPPDNPFADGDEGAPEVWAYGLRNPWRFHFDPLTGDLWVADVGQNNIEEITRIPAGEGGHNLGWDHWEGSQPFGTKAQRTKHLGPTAEYDHDGGHCSITGGPVARGGDWASTGLEGTVFLGDFCSGTLWTLTPEEEDWQLGVALETELRISGFGQASDGRIFLLHHEGTVYQVQAFEAPLET